MPYRIVSNRPLGQEIKRLFDQEIAGAVTCLTTPRRAGGAARLHQARTHIKKARALLQLAGPALRDSRRDIDEELRTANRALGPLSDSIPQIETLDLIRKDDSARLPASIVEATRSRMAADAAARLQRAALDGVAARTVRLLDSARRRALEWNLSGVDARSIAGEVRASHAAVRRAQRQALRRPTVDAYHRWRRLVKREWYLLRLISDLTGRRLIDQQQAFAGLDASLGELHDIHVLSGAVAARSPLSRRDTARLLAELHARSREGRRRAHARASLLEESPRDLGRRVRAWWGATPRPAAGEQPCRRRA